MAGCKCRARAGALGVGTISGPVAESGAGDRHGPGWEWRLESGPNEGLTTRYLAYLV